MNLILTGSQTEVLLVHMHVMRKNIKKVLKANYGAKEGKRLLKVYDSIKEALKEPYELMEADTTYPFSFDEEQMEMLQSFLKAFMEKFEEELKNKVTLKAEKEQAKEHMQFPLLLEVQNKVNELYKEGERIA